MAISLVIEYRVHIILWHRLLWLKHIEGIRESTHIHVPTDNIEQIKGWNW